MRVCAPRSVSRAGEGSRHARAHSLDVGCLIISIIMFIDIYIIMIMCTSVISSSILFIMIIVFFISSMISLCIIITVIIISSSSSRIIMIIIWTDTKSYVASHSGSSAPSFGWR